MEQKTAFSIITYFTYRSLFPHNAEMTFEDRVEKILQKELCLIYSSPPKRLNNKRQIIVGEEWKSPKKEIVTLKE